MKTKGSRSGAEAGFTLVELLVVIVIISILAAIAIPVFFAQRDKAIRAQAESGLKNAATIMQAWYTENSDYEPPHGEAPGALVDMAWLESLDWKPIEDLYIDIVEANGDEFCLSATHNVIPGLQMRYSSEGGTPEDGTCP